MLFNVDLSYYGLARFGAHISKTFFGVYTNFVNSQRQLMTLNMIIIFAASVFKAVNLNSCMSRHSTSLIHSKKLGHSIHFPLTLQWFILLQYHEMLFGHVPPPLSFYGVQPTFFVSSSFWNRVQICFWRKQLQVRKATTVIRAATAYRRATSVSVAMYLCKLLLINTVSAEIQNGMSRIGLPRRMWTRNFERQSNIYLNKKQSTSPYIKSFTLYKLARVQFYNMIHLSCYTDYSKQQFYNLSTHPI